MQIRPTQLSSTANRRACGTSSKTNSKSTSSTRAGAWIHCSRPWCCLARLHPTSLPCCLGSLVWVNCSAGPAAALRPLHMEQQPALIKTTCPLRCVPSSSRLLPLTRSPPPKTCGPTGMGAGCYEFESNTKKRNFNLLIIRLSLINQIALHTAVVIDFLI